MSGVHGCQELPYLHAEPSQTLPTKGKLPLHHLQLLSKTPYLNDDHSRIIFEEILEQLRQRHGFFLFGYVLMPNHVHLLLSEPTKQQLQSTLRVLKGETSKRLKGDRKQFWQTHYYDFNVLTHRKYVEKLRYIHRNPVERGLVEKPEDWPWSSYRHYLTREQGSIEIESEWTWNRRMAQV